MLTGVGVERIKTRLRASGANGDGTGAVAFIVAFDRELARRVREVLEPERNVTSKQMFGGLAFLINGNMAVSASGQGGLLLRVDPADTERLVGAHADRFEMRGRRMDGWLRIDPAGLNTDEELGEWVAIGVRYAKSLPPSKPA